ncbi:peptidase domain-containing ABC transporter [Ketobacter sp.]|nr:MAG: peptidase domain-containing ABC transporter [Ketobacter sp.]
MKVNKAQLIQHIVEGDTDGFGQYSPYARSLMPLLSVVDFKATLRDVAEVLPEGDFEFDLPYLRLILSRLGCTTEQLKTRIEDVPAHQLPCLFVSNSGDVYVLYQKEKDKYVFLNCITGVTSVDALSSVGMAYFVNHVGAEEEKIKTNRDWVWVVLKRFYPIFKYLFGLTLILNLTVLCVPFFIMIVYDSVIGNSDLESLWALAAGVILVLVTDLGLRLIRSRIMALPAGRLDYLLATETLKQVLSLPTIMTERASLTAQLSKFRLYESIREFFTGPTALLVLELPFVPLFITVLAVLGGSIALVPLVVMLIFLITGIYAIPKMKRMIAESAEHRAKHEQLTMELLGGVFEIKIMADEAGWMRRIQKSAKLAAFSNYNVSRAHSLLNNYTQSILFIASVAVVWIGGTKAMEGQISIGALIACMAILWRVVTPMQMMLLTYFSFDQTLKGIHGINEIMALKPERNSSKSSMMKREYRGDVKLERVSFRYGPHLDPVLIGVSFHVKENEFLVIAGGNGSGKSTVLKLLCGMYLPQIGNILIDDTDIRQFNTTELRHKISYVPQYPRLFTGDIRFNLKLRDIIASDEVVLNALKIAGIEEQILALPNGLDTQIGGYVGGSVPSGIQRNLCIARSMVGSYPIVILDEPSAGLDRMGADNVVNLLNSLKGKCTIIVTSHAPEIIELADKVVEMERGLVKNVTTAVDYLGTDRKAGVLLK